jgi:hypothetical protein
VVLAEPLDADAVDVRALPAPIAGRPVPGPAHEAEGVGGGVAETPAVEPGEGGLQQRLDRTGHTGVGAGQPEAPRRPPQRIGPRLRHPDQPRPAQPLQVGDDGVVLGRLGRLGSFSFGGFGRSGSGERPTAARAAPAATVILPRPASPRPVVHR